MTNTSGIRPVEYKVLIKPEEVEARTAGGLYIPETVKDKEKYAKATGVIVALGSNCFTDPDWRERPAVGQTVIYDRYAGSLVKGTDGNDPSSGNPVTVGFRNSTLSSGLASAVQVTSALSTVISSGSTAGTLSNVPSRIWVALMNNGGAGELAWFQSVSSSSAAPVNDGGVISTSAEGGAGGADTAQVWYSTTARSSLRNGVIKRDSCNPCRHRARCRCD